MLNRLEILFKLLDNEEQGRLAVLDIEEIILSYVSQFSACPAFSVTRNEAGIRYGDSSMIYYIDHYDTKKLLALEIELTSYKKEKLTEESLTFKIYNLYATYTFDTAFSEADPLAIEGTDIWTK